MSVRFHKVVATWSLLALMAIVVTPPAAWHHHDAEVADHHANGGATIENVCPVCDHALPIAVQERPVAFSCVIDVVGLEGPAVLPMADVDHAHQNADRGPPALI